MSKVTTEACVAWLVKQFPDTKAGDWKRVKKYSEDGFVVREFENRRTGAKAEVNEQGGEIVGVGRQRQAQARTFTGTLTKGELAGAVAYAYATSGSFYGEDSPADCGNDPVKFLKENNFYIGQDLTDQVRADLEVLEFDSENSEWEEGEGYCGGETGFRTTKSGLTYLGFTAGGDWENPVYFIVYWDGAQLRGYIPKDGNRYNEKAMCAFGSEVDEDEMEKAVKRQYGVSDADEIPDYDMDAIRADIERNIVQVSGSFEKPKGLADIPWKQQQDAQERKREANFAAVEEARKRSNSMGGVVVKVIGASDPMDGSTLKDRLMDVRKDVVDFLAGIDELAEAQLGDIAANKALALRDGVLKRLVGNYVRTAQAIEACRGSR